MGKKLLLADDSVTIQKVVGISFANEDISITTVDNGDDALAKAKELRPDVVLADVVMPGKSGYEVCERIKKDPALRHIPVLLLTGTFEAFDEERARRVGAAGHVSKPFEAQTLVDRVKGLLAKAPRPAPAAAPPATKPAGKPAPARAGEEAFDFFDDGPSAPTGVQMPTTEPSLDDSFDLASTDSAFDFGDDDLGVTPPSRSAPEATVAILPDEPRRGARGGRGADPDVTTLDPALFGDAEDGGAAPADAGLTKLDPRPMGRASQGAGAASEDAFDFEFETGPSPAAPARPAAGAGDLAEATILDPDVAMDFAVSSSDLDQTLPPSPARGGAPLISPLPSRRSGGFEEAEPDDLLSAEPLDEAEEADPFEMRAPAADTAPSLRGGSPAGAARPAPRATPPSPATAPRAPSALLSADDDEAESLVLAEPLPELEEPPARAQPARRAAAPAGAAVDPGLRDELHETLEKIAWEAFGQITEKIVQDVVQRLETVAWDVVPKLAEALIQEEIRKLKGESQ